MRIFSETEDFSGFGQRLFPCLIIHIYLHTDNDPRPSTGPPTDYEIISAHWLQSIHSCYKITTVFYQSVAFTANELGNFSLYIVLYGYHNIAIPLELTNPHRRIILNEYYLLHISDADYKSVSLFIILHFIILDPYKCAYPNTHRRKVCYLFNMSYIGDAEYKSYLGTSCDCLVNVPYLNFLHFTIPKHCIFPTKMYIYNVIMYISECLNIFLIFFNPDNQAMLIKSITLPSDFYLHG